MLLASSDRNYSKEAIVKNKHGFNGKLNDDEVYGVEGSVQDYGMRINDTRLIRFFSVDPIAKAYPYYSPYQFAGNRFTFCVDQDGLEDIYYNSAAYYNDFIWGMSALDEAGIYNEMLNEFSTVHMNGKVLPNKNYDIHFTASKNSSTGEYAATNTPLVEDLLSTKSVKQRLEILEKYLSQYDKPTGLNLIRTIKKGKIPIVIEINMQEMEKERSTSNKSLHTRSHAALTIYHEFWAHARSFLYDNSNYPSKVDHGKFFGSTSYQDWDQGYSPSPNDYQRINKNSTASKAQRRIEVKFTNLSKMKAKFKKWWKKLWRRRAKF